MVKLFYTTYISVDLAHQVIFHVKVGKVGIKMESHVLSDSVQCKPKIEFSVF